MTAVDRPDNGQDELVCPHGCTRGHEDYDDYADAHHNPEGGRFSPEGGPQ